ncbi:hypothetical protein GGI12_004651 [Dipsacomyces acuminosporus]|nr:hypothetical protein GGI12_004651 [Dipsacomyces acuminosporus]
MPAAIPLTPVESIQGTYKMIQPILLFKDPRIDEKMDFADSSISVEQLKGSSEKLIEFYPLLQGHIDPLLSDGVKTVQISEEDKEKQLFTSIIEDRLSVEEFLEIKYRRELWPVSIEKHLSEEAKPDLNKLALATVVRFKNGYLISLAINHILSDSAGVSILLQQWGSLSRDGRLVREVDFGYERYWSRLMSVDTPDAHPLHEHTKRIDDDQVEAAKDMLVMLLQNHTTSEAGKVTPCILHVPKEKLDQLALDFNKDCLDGKPMHGIQILYTLLWQRYVAAIRLAYKLPQMEADEMVYLNILHNTRKLVGGCDDYIGNSVTPKLVAISSKEFSEMPTIRLARYVKSHINTITPGAAADYSKELSRPDYDLLVRTMILLQRSECRYQISNLSRFPFFDIDFGNGTPEAMLWGNKYVLSNSIWLPLKDGGVDIYLGLEEPMLHVLPDDKILSKYCQFVSF